jgi:hypothetical protein
VGAIVLSVAEAGLDKGENVASVAPAAAGVEDAGDGISAQADGIMPARKTDNNITPRSRGKAFCVLTTIFSKRII